MVQSGVTESFDKSFSTTNPEDAQNELVALIQSSFSCCGTDDKSYWNKRAEFTHHLPLSCCPAMGTSSNSSCGAKDWPSAGTPFSRSCIEAVDHFLHVFTNLLSISLLFSACVKMLSFCFAFALFNSAR